MPPDTNSGAGIEVKICGLDRAEAVDAAVAGGARYAGFVFYPPSPRNLSAGAAKDLTRRVPAYVVAVGLFVDPTDEDIKRVLDHNDLGLIQLHGAETPERVQDVKRLSGLDVMKVVKLAGRQDLKAAGRYFKTANKLIFDAKPPADMAGALPGGNALKFDWQLLSGAKIPIPWMLAGGLTAENLREAVAISGARAVDVSSGVESSPGVKSITKINEFLSTAQKIRDNP
ncbi:MAG: phosphoribosylanthranilate isomerase [Rhodospirillales bacterium]|nr:phosphoribosylanthranilate isomerase [Rhodospirillales bacterium]